MGTPPFYRLAIPVGLVRHSHFLGLSNYDPLPVRWPRIQWP